MSVSFRAVTEKQLNTNDKGTSFNDLAADESSKVDGVTFFAPSEGNSTTMQPLFSIRWNKGCTDMSDAHLVAHRDLKDILPPEMLSPDRAQQTETMKALTESLIPDSNSKVWKNVFDSRYVRQKLQDSGFESDTPYSKMALLERLKAYAVIQDANKIIPGTSLTIGPSETQQATISMTPHPNIARQGLMGVGTRYLTYFPKGSMQLIASKLWDSISNDHPDSLNESLTLMVLTTLTPNQPDENLLYFGTLDVNGRPVIGSIAISPEGIEKILQQERFRDYIKESDLLKTNSKALSLREMEGKLYRNESQKKIDLALYFQSASNSDSLISDKQGEESPNQPQERVIQNGSFDLSRLLRVVKSESESSTLDTGKEAQQSDSREGAIREISNRVALISSTSGPQVAAATLALDFILKPHGLRSAINSGNNMDKLEISLIPDQKLEEQAAWGADELEAILNGSSRAMQELMGTRAGSHAYLALAGQTNINFMSLGIDASRDSQISELLGADPDSLAADPKGASRERMRELADVAKREFDSNLSAAFQGSSSEETQNLIGQIVNAIQKKISQFDMSGGLSREKQEELERAQKHAARKRPEQKPGGPKPQ